jgi:O-acetyl-ADP-ribose deacetylase (regulator of RNase III)
MMQGALDRSTEYRVDRTTLAVVYGDITTLGADALVSSDDNYLSMGGGVSAAIAGAAGEIVREEARKHLPLRAGDVAVTSAGRLPAKYVFHAVTIDYDKMVFPNDEIISRATRQCLKLGDDLGLQSLAFPALGTGAGGFPFQRAAEVMTRSLTSYLAPGSGLERVTLCLFARPGVAEEDINLFYERAAGLAAIAEQGKSLRLLMGDLERAVERLGRPDLAEEVARLSAKLGESENVLTRRSESIESLVELEEQSDIGRLSKDAVTISSEVEEETKSWNDEQAEADVLRTKLQGLLTILNIETGNLNKLDIQKAKHGIDVPLFLENSVEEKRNEIASLEGRIREVRENLSALLGSETA